MCLSGSCFRFSNNLSDIINCISRAVITAQCRTQIMKVLHEIYAVIDKGMFRICRSFRTANNLAVIIYASPIAETAAKGTKIVHFPAARIIFPHERRCIRASDSEI